MPLSTESHRHLSAELYRAQRALDEAKDLPGADAHEDCLERERSALQVASVLSSLATDHAEVLNRVTELACSMKILQARLEKLERLEQNPIFALVMWFQSFWRR